MATFVDLSHPIQDGMKAYPGFPDARVVPILTHDESREKYEGKAEFYLGRVELAGNTGTYLDAPFHRWRDGEDLAALPLERIADLPGLVVDAPAEPGPIPVPEGPVHGRAVLIRTGWDARWDTDAYYDPGPFLADDAIDALLDGGAALVGVDFANVDDTTDASRPAHSRLLQAGVPIVEHLTDLGDLPSDGFRFFATPPPLVRGASFPVRAFAVLPD